MKTSNRAVQAIDELDRSGFTEVVAPARVKSEIETKDVDMEDRLFNWGKVVNPIYTGSGQASTFWAARYYEIRNSEFRRELIARGLIEQKTVMQQIEDQAMAELRHEDALLIEAAWTKLTDFNQRQALLMRYVHRHKDEYIRNKLKLRGRQNLTLIFWRAQTSIKQILECGKKAVIIRSNNSNLFAG
jgi:hypothetical protein